MCVQQHGAGREQERCVNEGGNASACPEPDTRLLMDASFAAPAQPSLLMGREEQKARLSTDSSGPCFQWVAQEKNRGPNRSLPPPPGHRKELLWGAGSPKPRGSDLPCPQ